MAEAYYDEWEEEHGPGNKFENQSDQGYGMGDDINHNINLSIFEPWRDEWLVFELERMENLFPALPVSRLGVNVFSDEKVLHTHGQEPGKFLQEVLRKSNYMQYKQCKACKQMYQGDQYEFNA